MTVAVVGLWCQRCSGHSTMKIDPDTGLDDSEVWACPHCFNDDESMYKIQRDYRVQGFKPVVCGFERSRNIEDIEADFSEFSREFWNDFVGVRIRGRSVREQVKHSDVQKSALHTRVQKVTEALKSAEC